MHNVIIFVMLFVYICRYHALDKWTTHLQTLHTSLLGRVI